MDPERALLELLALDNSSSSSKSEQISLPSQSATALEREVLSSDDNEPETQFCFEHAVPVKSFLPVKILFSHSTARPLPRKWTHPLIR